MQIERFEQIIDKVKGRDTTPIMAVAAAADEHTLQAAMHARSMGVCDPVLVGEADQIRAFLKEMGESVAEDHIVNAADVTDAAAKAVALVREGKADFLMKGALDTKVILKAVVNKETGLGTGKLMTHIAAFEIPTYHKLLVVTDGGMVPYPDLDQKAGIIRNAVEVAHLWGIETPKVGVLACVEKVNPKMPETVDARALREMNERGELDGCQVEGPISYDCAMVKEIAEIKHFDSPVAGDADILIAPNIHAGNIMGKMLTCTAGAKMAGFICGAKCPIVLTSRGSSAEEKFLSILMSAASAE
jgi:phosphate butyryltransferase